MVLLWVTYYFSRSVFLVVTNKNLIWCDFLCQLKSIFLIAIRKPTILLREKSSKQQHKSKSYEESKQGFSNSDTIKAHHRSS